MAILNAVGKHLLSDEPMGRIDGELGAPAEEGQAPAKA
jgi:hypothetical protein